MSPLTKAQSGQVRDKAREKCDIGFGYKTISSHETFDRVKRNGTAVVQNRDIHLTKQPRSNSGEAAEIHDTGGETS